jgi:hypothetical protein
MPLGAGQLDGVRSDGVGLAQRIAPPDYAALHQG